MQGLKFNLAEVGGGSKFCIFVFVPALHLRFNFHIKILQMNRMIHPPFNVDQLFFSKNVMIFHGSIFPTNHFQNSILMMGSVKIFSCRVLVFFFLLRSSLSGSNLF